jgi:hypothetical protein
MEWSKVMESLRSAGSGNDDAGVLSRRNVLAGIASAGVFVVAGSTLLVSRSAEARINTPVVEPEAAPADAPKDHVGDNLANLDTSDFTEFSTQRYRRPLFRRPWRRRYRRVVCRRRWIGGRLVQVCRRVWW